MTGRILGIVLVALGTMLMLVFCTHRRPDNPEEFALVRPSAVRFLTLDGDSFTPGSGAPLVEAAGGKSFYEQNFDGIYNKLNMRCMIQILSGPSERSSLEDYRVLLQTSKAKLLLNIRRSGETTVSDDFVCFRDKGILAIPSLKEIEMADNDHLEVTLVRRRFDTAQSLAKKTGPLNR